MGAEKKEIAVGGQAVIEGVMMRGPEHIATAIRRKDGTIEVKKEVFVSITKKIKFLGFPIIRGFVSLIEMLKIGISTLQLSADRAGLDLEDSGKEKTKNSEAKEKIAEGISFVVAMGLAFFLFALLPYKLAEWIKLGKESLFFNLFAGSIRIVFFIVYISLISLMKDVRRVFEYHGAEHKSVFAYEKDDTLEIESIQKYSTLHPRCGTSFMFLVFLISILVFSVVDTLVMYWIGGEINLWVRLAYHLALIPLLSGLSYEVLRFSGKRINNPIVRLLTFPGMSMQRITTKKPDDGQVEVAVVALKAALELDLSDKKVVWL